MEPGETMDWNSKRVEAILEQALIEDKATSDTTSRLTIDPRLRATGTVLAKQDCVLSGLGCIPRFLTLFAKLDKKQQARFEVISHPEIFDGVRVRKGQAVAIVRHNARVLLACERVILNLMQRMSGIATLTRRYVDEIAGTHAQLLDTRKTAPGLRLLDKYAVLCGGGVNHRLDLSDGILIKNNHISLGGGLEHVLAEAKAHRQPDQEIEVEVRTFDELALAIAGGADSLLVDNMTPAEVKKAVKIVRARGLKIPIEASGGIHLENIRKYALAGADFISVGALTHSVTSVDLSMKISAEIP
jgi:nicotinate-nucleotide pyrophosphorylase (carboxylating)